MKKINFKIPSFFRNKYVLTILAFIVWMSFFDQNNLISQYRLTRKVDELREKKAFYQEQIKKDRKAARELNTNINTLEKYAREKYLMKRKNEDIFLIIEEEE